MTLAFSLFRIPVRVHLWFLLMALVLGYDQPDVHRNPANLLSWLVVVFLGVLCHELGHALAGKAFGWEPQIDLVGLGGRTGFTSMPRATPLRRIGMVAAGPGVGLVLGTAALVGSRVLGVREGTPLDYALSAAVWVNLGWGIFNLLPIIPLDGGLILDEIFRMISPTRGRRIACYVSLALTTAIALLMVLLRQPWIVMLAILFGMECWRLLQSEKLGYVPGGGRSARDHAYEALTRGDGRRVAELAGRAVAEASTQAEMDEAFYLLAYGRLLSGEPGEAKAALASISPDRPRDYALEGAIAFENGELDEALELFEKTLPKVGPFVEPRMIRAIIGTRRFAEARELFDDELGAAFAPRSLAEVHQAACKAGAYEPALGIGVRLFHRTGDGTAAFNVACCHARLGHAPEALAWLRKAHAAGFDRRDALDQDPDLESVRALEEWSSVRALFGAAGGS